MQKIFAIVTLLDVGLARVSNGSKYKNDLGRHYHKKQSHRGHPNDIDSHKNAIEDNEARSSFERTVTSGPYRAKNGARNPYQGYKSGPPRQSSYGNDKPYYGPNNHRNERPGRGYNSEKSYGGPRSNRGPPTRAPYSRTPPPRGPYQRSPPPRGPTSQKQSPRYPSGGNSLGRGPSARNRPPPARGPPSRGPPARGPPPRGAPPKSPPPRGPPPPKVMPYGLDNGGPPLAGVDHSNFEARSNEEHGNRSNWRRPGLRGNPTKPRGYQNRNYPPKTGPGDKFARPKSGRSNRPGGGYGRPGYNGRGPPRGRYQGPSRGNRQRSSGRRQGQGGGPYGQGPYEGNYGPQDDYHGGDGGDAYGPGQYGPGNDFAPGPQQQDYPGPNNGPNQYGPNNGYGQGGYNDGPYNPNNGYGQGGYNNDFNGPYGDYEGGDGNFNQNLGGELGVDSPENSVHNEPHVFDDGPQLDDFDNPYPNENDVNPEEFLPGGGPPKENTNAYYNDYMGDQGDGFRPTKPYNNDYYHEDYTSQRPPPSAETQKETSPAAATLLPS